MATEPTQEELSAYVDGELEGSARADLETHLGTCSSCRARLEGVSQAVAAIRGLPLETPPRAFTVPPQRRQSWRLAPAGWIGGLSAAALLLIALGITQYHGGTGSSSSASTANSHVSGGLAQGGAGAAPSAATLDKQAFAPNFSNRAIVTAAGSSGPQLYLAADGASFPNRGQMSVSVSLRGSPSTSLSASDQGLRLMLVRGGSGVVLTEPAGVSSGDGTSAFSRTYGLAKLALPEPRAGDYQLIATWIIPDGSGRVLQTSVPVTLTGG